MAVYQPVNVPQSIQQRLHARERQSVRTVRKRSFRLFMNLHEYCVNATRNSCPRERFDVFGLAARCITKTAG